MTIEDEPEDEQDETLVNSLLAKISLSRRSDNRHFSNRICNECLLAILSWIIVTHFRCEMRVDQIDH
jgi:hypothetical protein